MIIEIFLTLKHDASFVNISEPYPSNSSKRMVNRLKFAQWHIALDIPEKRYVTKPLAPYPKLNRMVQVEYICLSLILNIDLTYLEGR